MIDKTFAQFFVEDSPHKETIIYLSRICDCYDWDINKIIGRLMALDMDFDDASAYASFAIADKIDKWDDEHDRSVAEAFLTKKQWEALDLSFDREAILSEKWLIIIDKLGKEK